MNRTISRLNVYSQNIFCKVNAFTNKTNTNHLYVTVRHESSKQSAHTLAQTPLRDLKPPRQIKPSLNRRKEIGPGGWALLSIPIATFGLGTWQVQRRKRKLKLIEDLEAKTREPPIPLPEDLSTLSSLEYRKVFLKGKFDHSKELYLGPRSIIKDGAPLQSAGMISSGNVANRNGYHIITPFILSDSGKRILVDRGWVQTKMVSASKRQQGQVEDEQQFTGVIRLPEQRGIFMGENKTRINIFHYRDVDTMSKMCHTLPVFIDAADDSTVPGGPVGGQTVVGLRNEHMSYIITWYSLSAITFILWCGNVFLK